MTTHRFPPVQQRRAKQRGFTLLELLTVVAVVGILSAMLFPGFRSARVAAHTARTQVRFNQWAAALEGFRGEYGYYPALHPSNLVNPPGQNPDANAIHLFHDLLAARRRDGSALPTYATGTDPRYPEVQNRKLISFHSFAGADLTPDNLLRDDFDRTEIAVLVDRNLDGSINADDFGAVLPLVAGIRPGATDFPPTGIRAGVLFYAPGSGATADNPSFIFSWK